MLVKTQSLAALLLQLLILACGSSSSDSKAESRVMTFLTAPQAIDSGRPLGTLYESERGTGRYADPSDGEPYTGSIEGFWDLADGGIVSDGGLPQYRPFKGFLKNGFLASYVIYDPSGDVCRKRFLHNGKYYTFSSFSRRRIVDCGQCDTWQLWEGELVTPRAKQLLGSRSFEPSNWHELPPPQCQPMIEELETELRYHVSADDLVAVLVGGVPEWARCVNCNRAMRD